jgi:RNA recognition motif-containing protein
MSRLFLGNIPHSATESEISYWMQSYGFMAKSVDIIRDHATGGPRGFCFASLVDGQQADTAVGTLNGKIMAGRVITVNHAVPLKVNATDRQRRKVA